MQIHLTALKIYVRETCNVQRYGWKMAAALSKQPTTACLTWSARLSVCRRDPVDGSAHSELSSFVSTQQAIHALLATSILAEQACLRHESSTEPSCDVSPSLWSASSIRDHLLSKGYIVSDIWPVY